MTIIMDDATSLVLIISRKRNNRTLTVTLLDRAHRLASTQPRHTQSASFSSSIVAITRPGRHDQPDTHPAERLFFFFFFGNALRQVRDNNNASFAPCLPRTSTIPAMPMAWPTARVKVIQPDAGGPSSPCWPSRRFSWAVLGLRTGITTVSSPVPRLCAFPILTLAL